MRFKASQQARRLLALALAGASASWLALAVSGTPPATPDPSEEKPGGDTTVFEVGRNAFSFAAANLDEEGRTAFAIGNSFFRRNWVEAPSSTGARDGLGPLFIARSCAGCHSQEGRGAPPTTFKRGLTDEQPIALLFRLSVMGADGKPAPEPTYGDQFANASIQGVKPEGQVHIRYAELPGQFADGTRYSLRQPAYRFSHLGYGPMQAHTLVSPRLAQQLPGMGLIDAIPEADILGNAQTQAERVDAIHGMANRVFDPFAGKEVVGRFGWKANNGSLANQTAAAFANDIGITSEHAPIENCTPRQKACLAAPRGGKNGGPEIDNDKLGKVVLYQATLAVPARRDFNDVDVRRGQALFAQAQCAVCHRPSYTTGESPFPALSHQKIYPYTDMLLHDMGKGLADGRPDGLANGQQWRTPPLWGLGLVPDVNGHSFALHDGRARSTLEAILWHGGEADASRLQVLKMPKADRDALVQFVNSL